MITDYIVISESSRPKLEREVRTLIREGWEPIGGVAIELISMNGLNRDTAENGFHQTLIRRKG